MAFLHFVSSSDISHQENPYWGLAATNIMTDDQVTGSFTHDNSTFNSSTIESLSRTYCSPFTSSRYWSGSNAHNIGVLTNMDFYCNGTNSQKIIDFGVGAWLSEDERCGGLIVTGSDIQQTISQSRFKFNELAGHVRSKGYSEVKGVQEATKQDINTDLYNPSTLFRQCISHSLAVNGITYTEHTNSNYGSGLDGSMSESVDNSTFILRYSYDHVHYIDQVAGDWDMCYGTAVSRSVDGQWAVDNFANSESRAALETDILQDTLDENYKIYRNYILIGSSSLVYLS